MRAWLAEWVRQSLLRVLEFLIEIHHLLEFEAEEQTMRIAPIFIFALLMSTAASGQVFEDIWTNAGQNISYEIS